MTDNPFTRLADQQMVAATKARHKRREVKLARSEADAPMKLGELEQKLEDQSRQMRNYRAWKREEFAAMKNSHGEKWQRFAAAVDALSIENEDRFIAELLDSIKWLDSEAPHTRQAALSYLANRLINIRLANGYAPIDDSLPGEEPTLFEIIKAKLKVLTP